MGEATALPRGKRHLRTEDANEAATSKLTGSRTQSFRGWSPACYQLHHEDVGKSRRDEDSPRGRTRTCDPLLVTQVLYTLSYSEK